MMRIVPFFTLLTSLFTLLMNLLAHAFLSHPHEQVVLGNLMADSVKGRAGLEALPRLVQDGVLQHRVVDRATDEHPYCIAGRNTLTSIRALVRAPVFDILMDRLLARSWSRWTDESLPSFAERIRLIVRHLQPLHPPTFHSLAHRIITDGALLKGTTPGGLQFLLERIGERWGNSSLLLPTLDDFAKHEEDLLVGFIDFFPAIRAEAARQDFTAHY